MLREEKDRSIDSGMLPTPPLPTGINQVDLTDNAEQVFTRRYVRKDKNGELVESMEETFWRVAYHVALAEDEEPQTNRRKKMKVKTNNKAGGLMRNHNEAIVAGKKAAGVRVKTNVKAGGIMRNHNETLMCDGTEG